MIFYHASGPCLQPRRVRVSCVNIYLECARTMSADCLIKCATWRNLLCTLHCTWDALKVLQSSWHSTLRDRERETALTSFAVDQPSTSTFLPTMGRHICWALSCNSRQGHLSLNDVMSLRSLTQVTHMGAITHTPRCRCLCLWLCFCAFAFTFTFTFGLLWVLRQPVQHVP